MEAITDGPQCVDAVQLPLPHRRRTPAERKISVIHLFKLLPDRKSPCGLSMEFGFSSEFDTGDFGNLDPIMEKAVELTILINDSEIEGTSGRSWKDSSLKAIDVIQHLRKGNT